MAGLWADVRQLLLPSQCFWCQQPGSWACAPCQVRVRAVGPVAVTSGELLVTTAATYRELAPAILGYKERGVTALAHFLVDRLTAAVTQQALAAAVLVPIPTTARARRRRGADLVAELAVAVAAELGWQYRADLIWRGTRRQQKRLTGSDRYRNMMNAFAVRPGVSFVDETVVLIDDVLTTGATLTAAATALRSAQAGRVTGAVLAKSS